MTWAVVIIVGYGLGGILVSSLVARHHGVDLTRVGDGNPGASNARDVLGWRRAWPAFVGDGLKGLLAGLFGWALLGWGGAYAGVAAAMVGHALPVWHRGRGGKAIMTFVGGMFACTPLAALVTLAGFGVLLAATRSFSRPAALAILAVPVVQLLFDPVERVAATGGLMCLFAAFFLARRRVANVAT